jgi:hypothetical protein
MSYAALINTNLNRAFNLIKDLAQDVSYVKKMGIEFDFGAIEASAGTQTSVVIKTVVIDAIKPERVDSGHRPVVKQIMLKTKDAPDLSSFDHLVIDGAIYKVTPPVRDTGFVTLAAITKEL